MALSAFFLLIFLLQHLIINFSSVVSEDAFNALSHFMGTHPVVQFLLQPVLMAGVVFHFVMGFVLEAQNRSARPTKYAMNKGEKNAGWSSRNMLFSGFFILGFLAIHLWDFWLPEMNYKYVLANEPDATRYYGEMVHKFADIWRVAVYALTFVFLSLHLLHGFQSAIQSMGWRHPKYTPIIERIGKIYAIAVPAGFIFIALFHHFSHH